MSFIFVNCINSLVEILIEIRLESVFVREIRILKI